MSAEELRIGEQIRRLDGGYGVVVALQHIFGVAVRYNLTVQDDHTYAVGADQWVAHNTCENSTFYRTMSQEHYDSLVENGKLSATGETFITPSKEYAMSGKYDGVTVQFAMKPGALEELEQIGVRDNSSIVRSAYPNMPQVSSGWTDENAVYFKGEGDFINIGLGKGGGLSLFNQLIQSFNLVS